VKRRVPVWVTFVLIFASIACMAFGIYRGEVDTVLTKAINICMECIGLG
jgi:ABC-type dipeptide/oligopeptide/nickel transport system permease subunit